MLTDQIHDAIEDFAVGDGFVASFAIEDEDRDTPDALAGDAPVRACGDHVRDAFLTPGGFPLDAFDGFEGAATQIIVLHRNEPLLGGTENSRVVAAPAVRIAVVDFLRGEQRASVL